MSALDVYNLLVGLLQQNAEAFVALVLGLTAGLALRVSKRLFDRAKAQRQIKILESKVSTHLAEAKASLVEIEKLKAAVSVGNNESLDEKLKLCEEKVGEYERLLKVVEEQDGNIWIQPTREDLSIPSYVPLGFQRRAAIISFFNLKGGVGKTTLTSNLGVLWSQEKDVLLIDLDYQQSLTSACVKDQLVQLVDQERVINHVWQPGANMAELKLKQLWTQVLGHPKAFVVGVESNLADLETRSMVAWLAGRTTDDIRFRLRRLLHAEPVAKRFDYVLIDCPPRLTTACIGALAASDYVVIPVIPDDRSIDAVKRLVFELKRLKESMPSMRQLKILGVVGNRMSSRMNSPTSIPRHESLSWNLLMQSADHGEFHVFENKIRLFTDASKAVPFQSMHGDHRQEFENLCEEIETRISWQQSSINNF